jgi:hypothetical protein
MARINTHRSGTVDSLYRGRSPDVPSSASQPQVSDQENDRPAMESSKTPAPTEPPRSTIPRSTLPENVGLRRENKRMRLDRGETPSVLVQEILSQHPQQDDQGSNRYYDPNQNPSLKRDLRVALRDSWRDLRGECAVMAACTADDNRPQR